MSSLNTKHVSVSKETYEDLSAAADARGVSMSSLVEQALAPVIGIGDVEVRKAPRYLGTHGSRIGRSNRGRR